MTPAIHCKYDELRLPASLQPHPLNPNKHSEAQLFLLEKIIAYQGWRHRVVVSNLSGKIVAGHGRVEVAARKGWEVPVEYQDFESEEQEYAFLVGDNNIAELADVDKNFIKETLAEKGYTYEDIEVLGDPDIKVEEPVIDDLDPKDMSDVETNFTFKIKCSSIEQLRDIQEFFGVGGEQTGYDKFKEACADLVRQ